MKSIQSTPLWIDINARAYAKPTLSLRLCGSELPLVNAVGPLHRVFYMLFAAPNTVTCTPPLGMCAHGVATLAHAKPH